MQASTIPPADHVPLPSAPADDVPRSFARQAFHDTFANWRARTGAAWIVFLAFAAVFSPFIASSHPYLVKMGGRWSSPLLEHLTPADVVLVIVAFSVLALLPMRRFTIPQKGAIVLWMLALAVPLASWHVIVFRGWAPGRQVFGNIFAGALLVLLLLAILTILIGLPIVMRISAGAKAALVVIGLALAALLLAFPVDPPETVVYQRYRELQKAGQIERIFRAPIPYSANDRLRDQPQLRLKPPWWGAEKGTPERTSNHWLGTDVNGADILSRMLHASRIALAIGFIATGIAVFIGVIIGGIMGFFVGKVDILGMRLVEIFEAIPTLFLLIAIVAFFERDLYLIMAVIGLVSWTGDARFIRAEFLKLRNQDFVQAAIAAGLPLRSVLFRHMLPNGITPVLVAASFGVASAILYESTLSFLGLGLVDDPSWGQMLNQALTLGRFTWWIALFPGLAIFLTVFAYNLVGESFRDAIDPRIMKR